MSFGLSEEQRNATDELEAFITHTSPTCVCLCSSQELRGKILLKAKKIGGLEVCPDGTLTDEVSDDEEMPNDEAESTSAENPPAECSNHDAKVRRARYF